MDKQKILVAGSDSYQSGLMTDCLERVGYQVLIADLAQFALQIICVSKPDLVLLEWKLPDLSGLAVIRQIRSDQRMADLLLILWGAGLQGDDVMLGLEAGADLCVKETFHPSVLIARVSALLRRCHARDPYLLGSSSRKTRNSLLEHSRSM